MVVARSATNLSTLETGGYRLHLDGGDTIDTSAVVLATGVAWRRLSVEGIDAFINKGVYYGAAQTEALGARGKAVYLVGGGNSAGQAAMLLSSYADSVTILVRGSTLAASMSKYLIDQLASKSNIRIEPMSEIVSVEGNGVLDSVTIRNHVTGEEQRHRCDRLFVFIGARAETEWLPSSLVRDEWGYVCTGRDVLDLLAAGAATSWPRERDPYLLETSSPGIFAAGDLRHGSIKRVAAGVGEGSMSIAFVHQYLAEMRERPH